MKKLSEDEKKEIALKDKIFLKEHTVIYKEKMKKYQSVVLAVYITIGLIAFISGLFIPIMSIKLGLKYAAFIFFFMSFINAPHTAVINFAFFAFALIFVLFSIFYKAKKAQIGEQE